MNKKNKIALIAMLAGCLAGNAMATSTLTNYTTGDVLICFRNGGNGLVADAGPVTTLLGYAANSRTSVSAYTTTQIGQVGLDGVQWSAFTWLADDTLYMTKARTDLNSQTTPWTDKTGTSQNNVDLSMATVVAGAANIYGKGYNVNSTASAVIEPSSVGYYTAGTSYSAAYTGAYGNDWGSQFQGDTENDVSGTFSTDGQVARSDFYQMTPTGSFGVKAVLVGYFELQTNGTMVYVAYPSATPVIKSITRSGTSTTITYTTGLYGTYTLRSNSSVSSGTPQISWTSVQTLASGDTAVHSTTFTDTAATEFYTITAQ